MRNVRFLLCLTCSAALACGTDDDSAASESRAADASVRAKPRAPRVRLERPERGAQLVTKGRTIAAGADEEWCEVLEVPGDAGDTFFVGRTELAMTPFSHHLIVDVAPAGSDSLREVELGVPERCAGTHRYGNDLVSLAASSQPYVSNAYPPGIGLAVRGGQRVVFDYHTLNTGDEPIAVQHRLNLHYVDAIEKPARTFGFYNQRIAVAPHAQASFSEECRFKDELLVWSITRHTHRTGTDFRVFWAGGERDGELVWTSVDWERDVRHAFDPPVRMPAGTGFRWECDFQNPSEQTLTFGPQASDEMCILFGNFAAAGDDAAVGPQSCYLF